MSELQAMILAAAAVVAAVATLHKFLLKPLYLMTRRMSHFLDDWFGEDARPGRAAIPAMPERIARLERGYAEVSREQTALAEEVKEWMEESTSDRKTIRLRLDAVAATVEAPSDDEDQ